jgi:hypothetical protein
MVQPVQQIQGGLYRRSPCVDQVCPNRLIVRFDSRLMLGQSKLEANVAIHVTIGHMMNDLPDRPTAFSIRCVELSVI